MMRIHPIGASYRLGRKKQGFTLIELLIVVAIIAILAAIAVPNFLEAQVRSKVSRAYADMRTIATAIESYSVDYNQPPLNPPLSSNTFYVTPYILTTPIAYITSMPLDPFSKTGKTDNISPAQKDQVKYYDYYTIMTTEDYMGYVMETGEEVITLAVDASGVLSNMANQQALRKYGRWLQWSMGPDGQFWIQEDDWVSNSGNSPLKAPIHGWGYSFDVPYDATNGTVSFGNLIHCQNKAQGIIPPTP